MLFRGLQRSPPSLLSQPTQLPSGARFWRCIPLLRAAAASSSSHQASTETSSTNPGSAAGSSRGPRSKGRRSKGKLTPDDADAAAAAADAAARPLKCAEPAAQEKILQRHALSDQQPQAQVQALDQRAQAHLQPRVDELGWTCVPPSLIYRDYGTQPSAKIAAFDLDGTLILTKTGATFARGSGDWRFWSSRVPQVLQGLHEQGYKIVVFSNQGGVKSALTGKAAATAKGKAHSMLMQAGVPALVLMATGKDQLRKPNTGMWDLMCAELNGGVNPDKARCFFVGDAAGRSSDFVDPATGAPSTTDRGFAANVGIEFRVPEDVFG